MHTQISKPNYQWQYVAVAVSLAFCICGSFMLWKHKSVRVENGEIIPLGKIITTTTLPLRYQEVVGIEKNKEYNTSASRVDSTTKEYTTGSSAFSKSDTQESSSQDDLSTQEATTQESQNTISQATSSTVTSSTESSTETTSEDG